MEDDIYYLDPFVVAEDPVTDDGAWWGGDDVPDDAWFENWWDGYDDETYRDLADSAAAYDYFTQLERDINAKIAAANGGRAPAPSRSTSSGASTANRAGSSGGSSGGSSSSNSANQALQQVAGLIGNLAKALGLVKTPAAATATATTPAAAGTQLTTTGTIVAVAAAAAVGYLAVKALRK